MATLAELEAAFVEADKAGNAEDAQAFADEIFRMRSEQEPKSSKAPSEYSMPEYSPTGIPLPKPVVDAIVKQSRGITEGIGAIAEPVMSMASGLVAKPLSEIGALAATGYEMATGGKTAQNIPGFQRELAERFTYQPRTEAGASPYNPLNFIPAALGKAVGYITPEKAAEGEALTPGGVLRNLASEAVPQAIGLAGIKGAPKAAIPAQKASAALRGTAESLMQSVLKPSFKDLKSGKAATAIDTMLEQGVAMSPKARIEKIRNRIDDLNDQIRTEIAKSPERVKVSQIARPVVEKLKELRKQATPQTDIATLKKTWEDFKNHPLFRTTPDEIPVPLAQDIKTGTYRQLEKKYGQAGTAEVETQKTIARGLKEQIAQKVPKIAGLNAEESRLLTTLGVAERKIIMEANKNPMGLSLLAKDPRAWAAFLADRSGAAKTILAGVANRASKKLAKTAEGKTPERAAKTAAALTPTLTAREQQPYSMQEAFQ